MMWYLWVKDGIYSISNYKPDEDADILLESKYPDEVLKKMLELTRSNESLEDFKNSLDESESG